MKLNDLYGELKKVSAMEDFEACEYCGSDTKDDGLSAIIEEIDYLRWKEEEREDDFGTPSNYRLDPSFGSWREVNAMFL